MTNLPETFGSMVFNDSAMQERLPRDVYKSLRKTIDQGKDLDLTVANAVAITQVSQMEKEKRRDVKAELAQQFKEVRGMLDDLGSQTVSQAAKAHEEVSGHDED